MDRKEQLYSEYIVNNDELKHVLSFPEDSMLSHAHFLALTTFLKILQENDLIEYKFECDSFQIETKKYKIKLIVLRSSDFCFYTRNKKTGKTGNYTRNLTFEAVKNSLGKYIYN